MMGKIAGFPELVYAAAQPHLLIFSLFGSCSASGPQAITPRAPKANKIGLPALTMAAKCYQPPRDSSRRSLRGGRIRNAWVGGSIPSCGTIR